jgi:hypothetical protein
MAKATFSIKNLIELLTEISAVVRAPRRVCLMQTGYSTLNPLFEGCLDHSDEAQIIYRNIVAVVH